MATTEQPGGFLFSPEGVTNTLANNCQGKAEPISSRSPGTNGFTFPLNDVVCAHQCSSMLGTHIRTHTHTLCYARGGHSNMSQLRPGVLNPYTKEGVELLHFLLYIIGSKDKMCQWSSADFQCGQIVKNHFTVLSNSRAAKM